MDTMTSAMLDRHPLALRKMKLSEVQEAYPIPPEMLSVATKYGVILTRQKYLGMNHAGAGPTGIELGPFDDSTKEWVVFFHELGHIVSARYMEDAGVTSFLNRISCEAMAWEFGFCIANKEGYSHLFESNERQMAKNLFHTYNDGESWDNGESISRLLG